MIDIQLTYLPERESGYPGETETLDLAAFIAGALKPFFPQPHAVATPAHAPDEALRSEASATLAPHCVQRSAGEPPEAAAEWTGGRSAGASVTSYGMAVVANYDGRAWTVDAGAGLVVACQRPCLADLNHVHAQLANHGFRPQDYACPACAPPVAHQAPGWNDIVGQEHAKRAVEVAIAGQHSLLVVTHPGQHGETIAHIARRHGAQARAVPACACGWYRDPKRECTCSVETIGRWQAAHFGAGCDITVETYNPGPDRILDHFTRLARGRATGEPLDAVLARVERARAFAADHTSLDIDDAGASLVHAFIRHLDAGPEEVGRALRVARTIANLAGASRIHTAHLAEAMQYRRR